MFESLVSANQVSFILVFFEGLLSFLSPCVIPLIPIYMSYLAGGAKQTGEDGMITYHRKKVFLHTLFFVLGISFAFFLLGMSFTALGSFFRENQLLFTRIGGILIIVMGLIQIGFLEFKILNQERKIHLKIDRMNPLAAFLMGFTFSFAWTPCVGPALSSVLILASGAKSSLLGNALVLIYTLGFVIPFLLLGIFTTQALNFLKGHQKLLKYTVKAGGLLLILIGLMTFTGWMNGISRYLNNFTPPAVSENGTEDKDNSNDFIPEEITGDEGGSKDNNSEEGNDNSDNISNEASEGINQESDTSNEDNTNNNTSQSNEDKKIIPAFDFTLKDQYGNEHTLSDYKGKVVFLNFWASWCGPCKEEMPEIEELYEEYGKNQGDVIILGAANPSSDEYPNNNDVSEEEIAAFLEENNLNFPTVYDVTGDVFRDYYITAFPTTFLVDKEGNIYGYAQGQLTKDMMKNAIEQAIESTE